MKHDMRAKASLNRRHAIQLGAVLCGGWAIGQVLRRTAPIGRDVSRSDALLEILKGGASPTSGPASASLRLAVFTDYRCPACRQAYPAMEEAVRDDGDLQVIYKDWPIFGPISERAASVALASAEQGIYVEVHHRLMTDNRSIDEAVLREALTEAGGEWGRAQEYLKSNGSKIAARLEANTKQAFRIGLSGTPGFIAGPLLVVGAIDKRDFSRLFAKARAAS
ncbi:DsbA family protein [Sphingomonas xinjiangensis]|uniref:Protein-disulfide isomerase n=1 Tax=Sphingomonas xinjiangensis TaxID=643568 RepID=A0A840YSF8_9SPHN|nr:DsbA family protein [Sphingomonas xinjiangensis]MBB5712602.1 protein-disulfide isomerase [Sphingomonas xinjiangensis]